MISGSERRQHLWGIDCLRFAAALLVAFFHLTWAEQGVTTMVWFGWIGVQIFFVISGLVIARSANNTTPLRFVESRALRLYPAAWTCAVVGLLVAALVHHPIPDLAQRFLNSFFLAPVGPFLATAYWTLPIELAFYALIFVLLLVGAFDRLERVAVWLSVLSAAYNVALALQVAGLFAWPDLDFGYEWKNMTLLRHGIYFAIGIFIWLWSQRRLSRIGWAAFVIAVTAAPVEITCRTAELVEIMPVAITLAQAWLAPVLLWVAAVAAIVWSTKWEHKLGDPPKALQAIARSIGLATYPLYLLHEQLGEAARNWLLKFEVPFFLSVCLAILLSTMVALAVAVVVEPSVRRIMRGWLRAVTSVADGTPWLQRLLRPGGTL